MESLVGFTGFVGSNIASKTKFDGLYNSKNILDAYGTRPDILVYCGVRAEKFLANKEPEKDYATIQDAIKNIQMINPKTLILISTIDVYKNPCDVDEDSKIDISNLHAYGYNRYLLEKWVEENINDHLIIRLPGLFGKGIKKNFIYDMINIIPSMLSEAKFNELSAKNAYIDDYYIKHNNGFYKQKDLLESEKARLRDYFNSIGFCALNFTDSRTRFQFYNLDYLWQHIQTSMENDIRKVNLSTEPVTAGEVYKYVSEKDFVNKISDKVVEYNFKTKYSLLFGGKNGYIFDKTIILKDIRKFVKENTR